MNSLRGIILRLSHFFFPVKCHFCLSDQTWNYSEPLCPSCLNRLRPIGVNCCRFCGALLERGGDFCGCGGRKNRSFEFSRSAYMFGPELRELIHDFKYRGFRRLGLWLGAKMAECFSVYREFSGFDTVVPVPIFSGRMRQRGYNQSLILSEVLAVSAGLKLESKALIKKKNTGPQASLGRKERESNLKGAFAVESPDSIKGRKIILIDDVATTLSTLNEASAALLGAGASRIACYTLARE